MYEALKRLLLKDFEFSRIKATTEVSDDLLQAKSKGEQATNDFVVSCYSSHPTLDLKAVCKVRNKDLVLPLHMDCDVCSNCTSQTV